MPRYYRPTTKKAALDALAEGVWTIIAGGTDIYPARVGRPVGDDLLDIGAVEELHGIEATAAGWRLGAMVTWSELRQQAKLPPLLDGLRAAAAEVGGRQIQNRGTLGGNLVNASPAADGTVCLLALDAEVELASASATRRLPLSGFLLGNRRTARRPDELVVALHIPAAAGRAAFAKLGARRFLVISIVMVAATLELDAGRILRARIAVGACAPVPVRLTGLETRLAGMPVTEAVGSLAPGDLAPIAPIDDIRGSAGYRRDAALTLVRRTLVRLGAAQEAA